MDREIKKTIMVLLYLLFKKDIVITYNKYNAFGNDFTFDRHLKIELKNAINAKNDLGYKVIAVISNFPEIKKIEKEMEAGKEYLLEDIISEEEFVEGVKEDENL